MLSVIGYQEKSTDATPSLQDTKREGKNKVNTSPSSFPSKKPIPNNRQLSILVFSIPLSHHFNTPIRIMKILTNMRFWQSRKWTESATSIYPRHRLPLGKAPLSPLREAITLYREASRYDVIVTMGARESLTYGLLCLLTGRPSKQVMTEIFIDEPSMGLFWHTKLLLYRIIAERCYGILTNSSAETDSISKRFLIPKERTIYVPMHTNILDPRMTERDEGFILSAGFTQRDFDCLIRAADKIPCRIVIICGHEEKLPTVLHPNVEVHRSCSRDDYMGMLNRCSLVVLPLTRTSRSTGQVVLLEAMALGKPVIASRAPGMLDHIRHGENGLLFDAGDSDTLAAFCCDLIGNPAKATALGQQALNDVLQHNTIETHAENRLNAIKMLWEKSLRDA
jgi:glycosyltransferase involved in cell wall biosynthesis